MQDRITRSWAVWGKRICEVVGIVLISHEIFVFTVRWIGERETERFYSDALTFLGHEPKLSPHQASEYTGLTRQRIHQLNDEGQFGGVKRFPLWVTPSELEPYRKDDLYDDRNN